MGAAASLPPESSQEPAASGPPLLEALKNPDRWDITMRPDGSLVHRPLPGNPSPLLVTPGRPGSARRPIPALRPSSARRPRRPYSALAGVPFLERVPSAPTVMQGDEPPADAEASGLDDEVLMEEGEDAVILASCLPKAANPSKTLAKFLKADPCKPPEGMDPVCCSASVGYSGPGTEAFADYNPAPGWRTHVQHILVMWDDRGIRGYQLTLFNGHVYRQGVMKRRGGCLLDFTFQSDEMLASMSLRETPVGDAHLLRNLRFTTCHGNVFEAGPTDYAFEVHLFVAGTFLKGLHGCLQVVNGRRLISSLGACTTTCNFVPIAQAVISSWADGPASSSPDVPRTRAVYLRVPGASRVEYGVCLEEEGPEEMEVLVNGEWTLVQAHPSWTRVPAQPDKQLQLGIAAARPPGEGSDPEAEPLPCPKLRVTCMKATVQNVDVNFDESLGMLWLLSVLVNPANLPQVVNGWM